MNTPMILPWIARRAGITEARAEALWHEALRHATDKTGWIGSSDYWAAAQAHFLELVSEEAGAPALHWIKTPELAWLTRIHTRIARLPMLYWQGGMLYWLRELRGKQATQ